MKDKYEHTFLILDEQGNIGKIDADTYYKYATNCSKDNHLIFKEIVYQVQKRRKMKDIIDAIKKYYQDIDNRSIQDYNK